MVCAWLNSDAAADAISEHRVVRRLPATLDRLFSEVALNSDAEDIDVLVDFMSQRVRDDFAFDAEIQGIKQ